MPRPVIRPVSPSDLPAPLQGLVRLIGMGGPEDLLQPMEVMTPGGVPLMTLMRGIRRLPALQGTPEVLQRTIRTLAERYPRLMSHVRAVEVGAPDPIRGYAAAVQPVEPGTPPFRIAVSVPTALQGMVRPEGLEGTIRHELAHVAQGLRRISRQQPIDAAPVTQDLAGWMNYFVHPTEVSARISEARAYGLSTRRPPGATLSPAEAWAWDPQRYLSQFVSKWGTPEGADRIRQAIKALAAIDPNAAKRIIPPTP